MVKNFEIKTDINKIININKDYFLKYQKIGYREYFYFGYKNKFNNDILIRIYVVNNNIEISWTISKNEFIENEINKHKKQIIKIYKNLIK